MKFLYLNASKVRAACQAALSDRLTLIESSRTHEVDLEVRRRLRSLWVRMFTKLNVDPAQVRREMFPVAASVEARFHPWFREAEELLKVCELAILEHGVSIAVAVSYEDVNGFLAAYWPK